MLRQTLMTTLFLIAGMTAGNAQWFNSANEDAFNGDAHLALTGDADGYAFGFRCKKDGDVELVFGTPETYLEASSTMSALSKIVVIVDDQPVVSLNTEIDSWGDNKMRLTSADSAVTELMFASKSAKRRVAVAIDMLGKKYHSKVFRVAGVSKAVGKLIDICKIERESDDDKSDAPAKPAVPQSPEAKPASK